MAHLIIPTNELNEFDLPAVCVVTGSREGVAFKPVKFQWYPRWILILALPALLIAVILSLILTKRVKGKLPFSAEGYSRYRRASVLRGLSFFLMVVLIVVSLFVLAADNTALGMAILAIGIALPIVLYFAYTRERMLLCRKIADGQITLEVPSDAAASTINHHLRGGTAARAAPVAKPAA